MEMVRGLGWLPDVPKPSDYTEEHDEIAPLLGKTQLAFRVKQSSPSAAKGTGSGSGRAPAAGAPGPVDLRNLFSPIEDQGSLGSCTANAAVGLLEYFQRKSFGTFLDASRLFV